MTERVVSGLERWSKRIMVFCAAGTCLALAGLAAVQWQVLGQASRGNDARTVQELRSPIAVKMAADAERRGVITSSDLACYRDVRRCKPVAPTPVP